jgi:hypothetical protein
MGNRIGDFPGIEHATGDDRVWINLTGGAEVGDRRREQNGIAMKQHPHMRCPQPRSEQQEQAAQDKERMFRE